MPCYRRGSRSSGKLGDLPESHSADGQSPSRPGVGPLGYLWSPEPWGSRAEGKVCTRCCSWPGVLLRWNTVLKTG